MKKEERIIAIDPGGRYQGITVFQGKEIMDSSVKTLSPSGSPRQRLNEVKRVFSALIEDYAPEVLVVEKPFPFWTKQSRFLDVMIDEIKYLARKEKLRIYEFSPKTVRKVICGNGSATKKDLARILISLHPELSVRLNKDGHSKKTYWNHVLDATALGFCYLKSKKTQR